MVPSEAEKQSFDKQVTVLFIYCAFTSLSVMPVNCRAAVAHINSWQKCSVKDM